MFFNKKKEIDRKTRFQQVAFKRELDRARSFKRQTRNFDSKFSWFSWKRFLIGFAVVVFLSGMYYVLCVPNFLFVKTVIVQGQGVDSGGIESSVNRFLDTRVGLLFPRRNMLFLDSESLQDYVLKNNPAVYEVSEISKRWSGRAVEIVVVPRTNKYVFETTLGQEFIASNDGKVVAQKPPEAPELDLIRVKLDKELVVGEKYFSDEMLAGFSVVKDRFFSTVKIGFKYIDASGATRPDLIEKGVTLSSRDFIVETQPVPEKRYPEFMVFFDSQSDIPLALDHLRLLLQNTDSGRLQNLAYIDMRFKGKSFLCLKNTLCEQAPPPPPPAEPPPPPGESLEINQLNQNNAE